MFISQSKTNQNRSDLRLWFHSHGSVDPPVTDGIILGTLTPKPKENSILRKIL
jgi:hypothetical protein